MKRTDSNSTANSSNSSEQQALFLPDGCHRQGCLRQQGGQLLVDLQHGGVSCNIRDHMVGQHLSQEGLVSQEGLSGKIEGLQGGLQGLRGGQQK